MFPRQFSSSKQPFVHLALALSLGIVLDRCTHVPLLLVAFFAGPVLIPALLASARHRTQATAASLLCLIALAGLLLSRVERTHRSATSVARLVGSGLITVDESFELEGILRRPPEPAPAAYILDVDTVRVTSMEGSVQATGRVRLTVFARDQKARNDFLSLGLDSGTRISAPVILSSSGSYKNPGSPDYNAFLERRGYEIKASVKKPSLIERCGQVYFNPALGWLLRVRIKFMSALDGLFEPSVSGSLKAMLTGNRYFVDRRVEERLRESATFHVLVIAGLHASFIALVILRGTGLVWSAAGGGRSVWRDSARALISISALWLYAFMTGLAPPVVRAAAMTTIGLVGPLLCRRAPSLNSVAMAAFLMLVANPSLIADPGFQLSFAAVFGITGLALPLADTLRKVGEWKPAPTTPHPPVCSRLIRGVSEILFWNDRKFRKATSEFRISYKPEKHPLAIATSRMRLQWLLRSVGTLLMTSAAIQASTLPLMAYYFNRVAPIGVLLNVIAGLLTFVMMAGSIVAIAARSISTSLTSPAVYFVERAHWLLTNAIVPFSHIPGATFRVAHYDGAWVFVYGLYLLSLAVLSKAIQCWHPVDEVTRKDLLLQLRGKVQPQLDRPNDVSQPRAARAWKPALVVASTIALGLATINPRAPSPDGKLTVYFLDVGQGDSALIVFPGGATMLVDAGGELQFGAVQRSGMQAANQEGLGIPLTDSFGAGFKEDDAEDNPFNVGEAVVCRFLWSQGRTSLDWIVGTHAHADHIGGIPYVERNFHPGEALVGRAPRRDPEFERLRIATAKNDTPLHVIESGRQYEIEGVSVQVLWPPPAKGEPVTSGNNDSVVLRLVYGSVAMLLAGDIELETESLLVKSGFDLRADIIKVPHHGSKTSSSESLLDAVRPRCAVISVGENSRFGHPHAEVLSRYRDRGIRLFQTGRNGTVTAQTDGHELTVETYEVGSRQ